MKIAIASGKGGTGKTLVATNLAAALRAACLDLDVEGANGHLFTKPRIDATRPAMAQVPVASDACVGCGECARVCRFGAMAALPKGVLVFNELCHSCGACIEACPKGALDWAEHPLGTVRVGTWPVPGGGAAPFADGELATGEVRAATVIAQVKEAAPADTDSQVWDCPPGASCAVAEALKGADLCLLVTEPTPFGLSDLGKAADLAAHFGVPHAVILNRAGLAGSDVRGFCAERGLPVVLEIPYDAELARHYAEGHLAYEAMPRYRETFDRLAADLHDGTLDLARREPAPAAGPAFADPDAAPDNERCTEKARPEGLVQVAVISGKGGTGKTSLAASLAAAMEAHTTADCDVDAANLHLLLPPRLETSVAFVGSFVAEIDPALCRGCGVCAGACRFDAIALTPRATVDPLACEGCGLCAIVCPLAGTDEMPVAIRPRVDGTAYCGTTDWGGLARGALLAGGEASGKLVTLVRSLAERQAGDAGAGGLLIDASPGMGCPVNAAVTGVDLAVAVTEPTQSGLHDLGRALDLATWFQVPAVVMLNKADLAPGVAADIASVCRERGVEVIGEVPFDRQVPEDLAAGRIPSAGDGPAATALRAACAAVLERAERIGTEKAGRAQAPAARED